MQEVTVGELKANFSTFLERVARGEDDASFPRISS
jgi:antitoxin (DNA-binding transcriptional repressor) of toxin-antitoxin stability system